MYEGAPLAFHMGVHTRMIPDTPTKRYKLHLIGNSNSHASMEGHLEVSTLLFLRHSAVCSSAPASGRNMLASGQTCRGARSMAVPVHDRRRPFIASNARPRLTACAAQEGLLDTSTSSAAIPCCSSSSSSGSHAWAPSLAVPETQAQPSAAHAQTYTPPAGRQV